MIYRRLRQAVDARPTLSRYDVLDMAGPVAQRLEQRTHNLLSNSVHHVVSTACSGDVRGFSGIFGTVCGVLGPNWDRVLGPAIHCGRASSFVRCSSSTLFANSRI